MTDIEIPPFPDTRETQEPQELRLVPRHPTTDTEQITQARQFDTGATRSSDEGKLDLEGFLSPLVLMEYGRYMDSARRTPEGIRDSDNWQKGIPQSVYMKSMWRHFHAVWLNHRGHKKGDIVTDLMAMLFNLQGMAHEIIKERNQGQVRSGVQGNL